MTAPPVYSAGLVGEQHYARAVGACAVGDPAAIVQEVGNPHDDEALAVVSSGGDTLGYLPRNSWLREAILEEEKGCDVTIAKVVTGQRGFPQIVLGVTLGGDPVGTRDYVPPE